MGLLTGKTAIVKGAARGIGKAVALKFKGAKIPFRSEVNSTEFEEIKSLGQDLKRFDFVIQTKKKTYLMY